VLTASLTKVTVGVPHASVAVTEATFGAGTAWLQVSVGGAGQVMVGGVLSITLMICDAVAVLPHASVAVHLRVRV
jgi:hypothetical protein